MFDAIIGWLGQLWSFLDTPVFTAYGFDLSVRDIAVGGMVTAFCIYVFWRGAKS